MMERTDIMEKIKGPIQTMKYHEDSQWYCVQGVGVHWDGIHPGTLSGSPQWGGDGILGIIQGLPCST